MLIICSVDVGPDYYLNVIISVDVGARTDVVARGLEPLLKILWRRWEEFSYIFLRGFVCFCRRWKDFSQFSDQKIFSGDLLFAFACLW